MAIIEVHGGRLTHKKAMRKSKDELAREWLRALDELERQDAVVKAADALLTRGDFWRNIRVAIPAEYDDLADAVARACAKKAPTCAS